MMRFRSARSGQFAQVTGLFRILRVETDRTTDPPVESDSHVALLVS
jgi:hypothetical protein